MQELLYYAMVGTFITLELEAVNQHEWRVLPAMRALPDRLGEQKYLRIRYEAAQVCIQ